MKKTIVFALVLGLVAGSLAAPALAKKKKGKKPALVQVDEKLFLRRDDCGGDADNPHLSVTDAPDGNGNGCGSALAGAGNEVANQAGESEDLGTTDAWPATDGVPFVLDGTKDISGSITVDTYHGVAENPVPLGVGQSTLDVVLSGTVAGADTELGTATATFQSTPAADQYTVTFTIKANPALDKASVTGLTLTTSLHGPAVLSGFYELDDPASFVTIPTWGKA